MQVQDENGKVETSTQRQQQDVQDLQELVQLAGASEAGIGLGDK